MPPERRVGLTHSRPKKLMHVTTVPMTFVFLRGQLGFMKSRGMEVHVMSAPGPEISEFVREEGATAHTVPMVRRITPLRDLRSLWTMTREFLRVRPDIVHASTPKGGLLGTIAARLARTPPRYLPCAGSRLYGIRRSTETPAAFGRACRMRVGRSRALRE